MPTRATRGLAPHVPARPHHQACNLGSRSAATAGAAVRSTIGFADGWAATTLVHDAQAFATRILGATGAWAHGVHQDVPLHRLAAFAHTLPVTPCAQGADSVALPRPTL
eukprot:scaffold13836_cov74-Phaeocystis_antarctica.AAC.4